MNTERIRKHSKLLRQLIPEIHIFLVTSDRRSYKHDLNLTLKMTSAQVVETSVTNNSSFQNYTHPDDHTIRTTDTPGFKPFTILLKL